MSLSAIILAAGRSTRMKSARPKPLLEVCGKSMLQHVLEACYAAGVARVIVVVGHGKDEVIGAFAHDKRITWVEQTEQLGTGHAAKMCKAELEKHPGDTFILAGDGPLIRGEVLTTLLRAHKDAKAAASMATAVLDDPYGYGRIVRDAAGDFVEIVEQADATPAQREIREVFPSYYCVKAAELLHAFTKLKNENAKGEYYLTDIYGILRSEGKTIAAVQAVTAEDVMAANDRTQLAEVDAIMQERIQRAVRANGVTIVSPVNTYIEAGVTVEQDTVIQPFTFIGRDTNIGRDCVIGPFASVPRNSVVRDGVTVSGNISAEMTTLNGA